MNGSEGSIPRTALGELARLLDGRSIRWALIGGLAANRYRRTPRHTFDVDVLLASVGWDLRELEGAMRSAGWSVRRADAEATLLRASHPRLGAVDLLVAGTEYQRHALARARVERVTGVGDTPVLTVEDVIVHKLIAGRHQDLADVEAILEGGVSIDASYVERWAGFWDVLDRWRTLTG